MTGTKLFVFGLGYSATILARRLASDGVEVAGTVRTPEKAARLAEDGIRAFVFDGTASAGAFADALAEATHVISSVAPGEEGDPVLIHARGAIASARGLRWLGYLSTVGVYGSYGGAWVTERTTPHPALARSVRRLEAEKAWKRFGAERDAGVAVFRIAGIYGPGRNAFVNLADGTARRLVKPGQVFNRIHVDDIAATVGRALSAGATGTFNLADDEPAPPQDVVAFAAGLMGVAAPAETPFAEAELSPMARSFYAENKRVSNRRIREELGVSLRYPTYREGLTALWEGGNWR